MNHLAHFALAAADDHLLVGGFLGDFVKGRLAGHYPVPVERGIRLHRAIDQFTDGHPLPKRSARRLSPHFYRYGGIITDIVYDHLLARHWEGYYDTPLEHFSRSALTTLLENQDYLQGPALKTATRMHAVNAPASYGNLVFIERSLNFLSTRLTRANPLKEAANEVIHHLDGFNKDFDEFFPELREFCDLWIEQH